MKNLYIFGMGMLLVGYIAYLIGISSPKRIESSNSTNKEIIFSTVDGDRIPISQSDYDDLIEGTETKITTSSHIIRRTLSNTKDIDSDLYWLHLDVFNNQGDYIGTKVYEKPVRRKQLPQ